MRVGSILGYGAAIWQVAEAIDIDITSDGKFPSTWLRDGCKYVCMVANPIQQHPSKKQPAPPPTA